MVGIMVNKLNLQLNKLCTTKTMIWKKRLIARKGAQKSMKCSSINYKNRLTVVQEN